MVSSKNAIFFHVFEYMGQYHWKTCYIQGAFKQEKMIETQVPHSSNLAEIFSYALWIT